MSRLDRWLDLFSVVPNSNPRPRWKELEMEVEGTWKLRKVTVVPVVIGSFCTIVVSWDWHRQSSKTITASVPTGNGQNPSQILRHLGPVFREAWKFFKRCWTLAQFLAHKPVNFASLTNSFYLSFSELLEPWSWMQTLQTGDFRETGPWGHSRWNDVRKGGLGQTIHWWW